MRHERMFLVKTPYVIFLSICQLPFSRHGPERCGQKRNTRAICGGTPSAVQESPAGNALRLAVNNVKELV